MTEVAVVIADDDESQRREIAEFLDRLGITHAEAADGGEAKRLFQELRPRIVLLDMNMPKIDGVEAFRWMREQDSHAKIILMSGYMNRVREANESELGAFAVIEKPIPLRTLGQFIKNVLAGHAPA
ncbi:MAG: response regulator [Tistlia sp.]|uniref:response regulator n=1 Tax=Tistlia sp. TaxID=3057121 RepID=UPI0034A550D8